MRYVLSGAALVLTSLVFSQEVRAEFFVTSGQRCHAYHYSPPSASLQGHVYRDRRGTGNKSTSLWIPLSCPTRFPGPNMAISEFFVSYSDNHPGTGSLGQDNIHCRLEADSPTFLWTSAWKMGCSTGGGCAAAVTSYKGDGTIHIVNPINSGNPITATAVHLHCRVPAALTTNVADFSFVSTFGINATAVP